MTTTGRQLGRSAVTLARACALAGGLGIVAAGVTAAQAQTYPDRPIKLVIPFSAGGPNDLIARPLTDKMSETLGQPFVIENKAGANGIIGTILVAKSAPDGYTMLMTTGSFANAAIDAKITYNALTDFAPVTLLAESYGLALMTRPDFPAKTLAEFFVALAKASPLYRFSRYYAYSITGMRSLLAPDGGGISLPEMPELLSGPSTAPSSTRQFEIVRSQAQAAAA